MPVPSICGSFKCSLRFRPICVLDINICEVAKLADSIAQGIRWVTEHISRSTDGASGSGEWPLWADTCLIGSKKVKRQV